MIAHLELHGTPFGISRQLKLLINNGSIKFGGNKKLKIYGSIDCASGKRMKAANRVFFLSELQAVQMGYRPCGHCMRAEYQLWLKASGNNISL